MRVTFTYSQEDMADAGMRFLARSKTIRATRWKNTVFSAALSGLLGFLLFYLIFKALFFGLAFGLLAVLVNLALGPSFTEHRTRKILAKSCKERFGDENEFTCEVELSAKGVMVREKNIRQFHPWAEVEDIVVTDNSVDIFASRGGVVVRNRAFTSPEVRQEFIDFALHHLELIRSSPRSE
jgi:hypothetical protein